MNTVQACPGPHLSDKKTSWLVSKGTVCCEPNVVPFRILALCITNLVLLCKLLNFAWFRHLSCLSISCSGREVNDKPTKGYQRFKNVQNYSDLNFSSIQHIQDRGLCLCVCVCVHICVSVCARMRMRDGWRVGDPSVTGMRNVQNLKALKWKDVKSKPETHVTARQRFGKDCRDPSFVSSRYTLESSMSSTTSASAFIYFLPRYKQLVWDTYPGSLPNLTDLAKFLDRLFPSFSYHCLKLGLFLGTFLPFWNKIAQLQHHFRANSLPTLFLCRQLSARLPKSLFHQLSTTFLNNWWFLSIFWLHPTTVNSWPLRPDLWTFDFIGAWPKTCLTTDSQHA